MSDAAGPGAPRSAPRSGQLVTATRYVLEGWPIQLVVRDGRDGWRVLGSQMYRVVDERTTRWDLLLDLDPGLATVPGLVPGSAAYRPAPDQPWSICHG